MTITDNYSPYQSSQKTWSKSPDDPSSSLEPTSNSPPHKFHILHDRLRYVPSPMGHAWDDALPWCCCAIWETKRHFYEPSMRDGGGGKRCRGGFRGCRLGGFWFGGEMIRGRRRTWRDGFVLVSVIGSTGFSFFGGSTERWEMMHRATGAIVRRWIPNFDLVCELKSYIALDLIALLPR